MLRSIVLRFDDERVWPALEALAACLDDYEPEVSAEIRATLRDQARSAVRGRPH
jgi:hypothetical protein